MDIKVGGMHQVIAEEGGNRYLIELANDMGCVFEVFSDSLSSDAPMSQLLTFGQWEFIDEPDTAIQQMVDDLFENEDDFDDGEGTTLEAWKPFVVSSQKSSTLSIAKYSQDQPRDYHGRFSSNGGEEKDPERKGLISEMSPGDVVTQGKTHGEVKIISVEPVKPHQDQSYVKVTGTRESDGKKVSFYMHQKKQYGFRTASTSPAPAPTQTSTIAVGADHNANIEALKTATEEAKTTFQKQWDELGSRALPFSLNDSHLFASRNADIRSEMVGTVRELGAKVTAIVDARANKLLSELGVPIVDFAAQDRVGEELRDVSALRDKANSALCRANRAFVNDYGVELSKAIGDALAEGLIANGVPKDLVEQLGSAFGVKGTDGATGLRVLNTGVLVHLGSVFPISSKSTMSFSKSQDGSNQVINITDNSTRSTYGVSVHDVFDAVGPKLNALGVEIGEKTVRTHAGAVPYAVLKAPTPYSLERMAGEMALAGAFDETKINMTIADGRLLKRLTAAGAAAESYNSKYSALKTEAKSLQSSSEDLEKVSAAHKTALWETLSAIRPFGLTTGDSVHVKDVTSTNVGGIQDAQQAIGEATKYLPQNWIERSKAASISSLHVGAAGRNTLGYYEPLTRSIVVKPAPVPEMTSTVLHEMTHHMQHYIDQVGVMDKAYWEFRCPDGKNNIKLSYGGKGNPDKFADQYSGKWYLGRQAWEISTRGMEGMLTGGRSGPLNGDRDYQNYMAGLLLLATSPGSDY